MWWNYSLSMVLKLTSKTRYLSWACVVLSYIQITIQSRLWLIYYFYCSTCMSLFEFLLQEGRTAVALASWEGHTDIVRILLQAGVKPDVQDQVTECVIANANAHHIYCVAVYVYRKDSLHSCWPPSVAMLMLQRPCWMEKLTQTSQTRFSVVCFMCGSCITARCVCTDHWVECSLLCC